LRNEWSLIFFTLLIQLAVGSFIIIASLNCYSILKTETPLPKEFTNKILWLILAASLIALVSSFLHLGRPKNALLTLSNLGSSWLSREILFVILFLAIVGIYSLLEFAMNAPGKTKMIVSIIGSIFGLLAVFSMAKLYMLETVPVWNSHHTMIQFFVTVFTLGLACLIIILLAGDYTKVGLQDFASIAQKILLGLIAISLILFISQIVALNSGRSAEVESFKLIIAENSTLFYANL